MVVPIVLVKSRDQIKGSPIFCWAQRLFHFSLEIKRWIDMSRGRIWALWQRFNEILWLPVWHFLAYPWIHFSTLGYNKNTDYKQRFHPGDQTKRSFRHKSTDPVWLWWTWWSFVQSLWENIIFSINYFKKILSRLFPTVPGFNIFLRQFGCFFLYNVDYMPII